MIVGDNVERDAVHKALMLLLRQDVKSKPPANKINHFKRKKYMEVISKNNLDLIISFACCSTIETYTCLKFLNFLKFFLGFEILHLDIF